MAIIKKSKYHEKEDEYIYNKIITSLNGKTYFYQFKKKLYKLQLMRRPLTTTFLLYALYVTRNPNIVYIEEIYELSSYKLQYNFTSRAVTFGLLCTLIHYKYTGSVPPTPVLH